MIFEVVLRAFCINKVGSVAFLPDSGDELVCVSGCIIIDLHTHNISKQNAEHNDGVELCELELWLCIAINKAVLRAQTIGS